MSTSVIRNLITLQALAFALLPMTALAQEVQPSSGQKLRRFSVSAYSGIAKGGPTDDLEQQMRQNGFDATTPGGCFIFCGGPTSHPFSSDSGWGQSMLAFKYRFNRLFTTELIFGSSDTGMTMGSAGYLANLSLGHSVTTISPLLAFDEGTIHLGLGPAVYIVSVDAEPFKDGQTKMKLGLLADAGMQFPLNSRFFIDFRVQYRLVGRAEVGPFDVVGFSNAATLPASDVSFSHAYLGVGFGIRF